MYLLRRLLPDRCDHTVARLDVDHDDRRTLVVALAASVLLVIDPVRHPIVRDGVAEPERIRLLLRFLLDPGTAIGELSPVGRDMTISCRGRLKDRSPATSVTVGRLRPPDHVTVPHYSSL